MDRSKMIIISVIVLLVIFFLTMYTRVRVYPVGVGDNGLNPKAYIVKNGKVWLCREKDAYPVTFHKR